MTDLPSKALTEDLRPPEGRQGVSSLTLRDAGEASRSLGPQPREEPRNRRLGVAHVIVWGGAQWLHKTGYDDECRANEVFVELLGPAPGQDTPTFEIGPELARLGHDACITLSHLVQRGDSFAAIALRLACAPRVPPSLLAVIAARAAQSDIEDGPPLREAMEAYRARTGRLPSGSPAAGEGA